MQCSVFVVEDKPYCVWEPQLRQKNMRFLEGVDPDYYVHVAATHFQQLQGDERNHAALAIRVAYGQALETLLAFLCATVQAPDCIVGWLQKYKVGQLVRIVEAINVGADSVRTKLPIDRVSWEQVSKMVHGCYVLADPDETETLREQYARFWSRLGRDFRDETARTEYNNIKHGLRIRPGGFTIAMGAEPAPGVPAPVENMISFGGSEFGSEFFMAEGIGSDEKSSSRHFRVRTRNVNWNPEQLARRLGLMAFSLGNVLSFLKIANGGDPQSVQFNRPVPDDAFEDVWESTCGVTSMSMDVTVPEQAIRRWSDQELLEIYGRERDKWEEHPGHRERE